MCVICAYKMHSASKCVKSWSLPTTIPFLKPPDAIRKLVNKAQGGKGGHLGFAVPDRPFRKGCRFPKLFRRQVEEANRSAKNKFGMAGFSLVSVLVTFCRRSLLLGSFLVLGDLFCFALWLWVVNVFVLF